MLGENGTGKTTFIKMLAGKDPEKRNEVPPSTMIEGPRTLGLL
jgi:ABC-type molybdenum transport system ATPase subunit/photorepair protein PhrA